MYTEKVYDINSQHDVYLFNFGIFHMFEEDSKLQFRHCHRLLELNYIKSGRGKYYIDHKVFDIRPGDIFVISNTEYHKMEVVTEELVATVIHFEPTFIWSQLNNTFDSLYLKPFFDRDNSFQNRIDCDEVMRNEIQQLFLDIEHETCSKLTGFNLIIKNKLLYILANLVRCYGFKSEKDEQNLFSKQNLKLLNKVKKFIDSHLNEELSLKHLAAMVHTNHEYFSQLFKKIYGVSPKHYILQKRIAKSIDLLQSTDKNILEIAGMCGFNNASNYNKIFKRLTGQVPSDLRNQNDFKGIAKRND